MGNLTQQEIADVLRVPHGTIKTRLRDGQPHLRAARRGRSRGRVPPPVGAPARLLPVKLAAFLAIEMSGRVTLERGGALTPLSGRAPPAGRGPSDPHKAHRVHMSAS